MYTISSNYNWNAATVNIQKTGEKHPKTIRLWPKNYPQTVFRLNSVSFTPAVLKKIP